MYKPGQIPEEKKNINQINTNQKIDPFKGAPEMNEFHNECLLKCKSLSKYYQGLNGDPIGFYSGIRLTRTPYLNIYFNTESNELKEMFLDFTREKAKELLSKRYKNFFLQTYQNGFESYYYYINYRSKNCSEITWKEGQKAEHKLNGVTVKREEVPFWL